MDENELNEELEKLAAERTSGINIKKAKPQTDHVIRGYDGFSEDDATADLLEAGADDMFSRPYEDFAEYVMVPDMFDDDGSIVSGSES